MSTEEYPHPPQVPVPGGGGGGGAVITICPSPAPSQPVVLIVSQCDTQITPSLTSTCGANKQPENFFAASISSFSGGIF